MSVPIADYALLSDRHTAALVSRTGSVDWLCAPRFDSPSLFGRLLDRGAGHFSVRPLDASADVDRRYVDETMVLETTWTTATGTLVVLDALASGDGGGDPHTLGANAPRALIRALECTAGQVEVAVEFAPRPEYGLVQPLLAAVPGGVMMRGGADVLALSCPVPLAADSRAATGTLILRAGEHATLGLTHRTTSEPYPGPLTRNRTGRGAARDGGRVAGVVADPPGLPGPVAGPGAPQRTGAAGAVLPAHRRRRGGADHVAARRDRRGTQLGLPLLLGARRVVHAGGALGRRLPRRGPPVLRLPGGSSAGEVRGGRDLQIMFGVGGEHDLTERELGHLAGWRGSRPVRVGNGAWNQRQVDVYGELLGAAHRLVAQLNPDHPGATEWREFLVACADASTRRWRDTDQGIWEVRGEPRHFLYSKLMCWVALDRAVAMADTLRATDRVAEWRAVADGSATPSSPGAGAKPRSRSPSPSAPTTSTRRT